MMKHITQTLCKTVLLLGALYVPLRAERSLVLSQQPISQTTTIQSPGNYKLAHNIDGTITITANSVTLDLNGYTISGSGHGIVISNASHISIRNGHIGPISGSNGIDITSGSQDITIEDIRIHQCDIGINAASADSLLIRKNIFTSNTNEGVKLTTCNRCIILDCTLSSNATGLLVDQSNDTHIQRCVAIANTSTAFASTSSNRTSCLECTSLLTGSGSANDSIGFLAQDGSYNNFFTCIANGTTTTATDASNIAAGFCFRGTESNSTIANCTASGSNTPGGGSSVAYGIFIEEVPSALGTEITANRTANASCIAWHPKKPLLVVTGDTVTLGGETTLYSFSASSETLTATDEHSHAATVNNAAWSTDGTLLATVGNDFNSIGLRLYSFNNKAKSLSLLDTVDLEAIAYGVSITSDNRFIATGAQKDGKHIRLYEVNLESFILNERDTVDLGDNSNYPRSFAWNPAHPFLAVGGFFSGDNIQLFELNIPKKELDSRDSTAHGAEVYSVAWSSNGKYLAVGGAVGTGSFDTRVYEFDATAKTLTLRDSQSHGATVHSVAWSASGTRLATGGAVSATNHIRIYDFDQSTKTLSLSDSSAFGTTALSVSWSAGGEYLGVAGALASNVTHKLYPALTVPKQCILNNNTAYGVRGNTFKTSTGISSPGLFNLVTANTAYDNDHNFRLVSNISTEVDSERTQNVSPE